MFTRCWDTLKVKNKPIGIPKRFIRHRLVGSGVTPAIVNGTLGDCYWTDGTNIYYSNGNTHYVLNKETNTWERKTWNGLTTFTGSKIWTDGDNVYYETYKSDGSTVTYTHYILDKATSTWSVKTWDGMVNFSCVCIWTDGTNVYCSGNSDVQYVLNKQTDTWETKVWNGDFKPYGYFVWSDGENIYYSDYNTHYILNKETDTWESKVWNGTTSFNGTSVWTDGTNIYLYCRYILNKETSTWEEISLEQPNENHYIDVEEIWTDGNNIYYSKSGYNLLLLPATAKLYSKIDGDWLEVCPLGGS